MSAKVGLRIFWNQIAVAISLLFTSHAFADSPCPELAASARAIIAPEQKITLNTDPNAELEPLVPEGAKRIFTSIQQYFLSPQVNSVVSHSLALRILRDRLKTSLFHLNFEPVISQKDQPTYLYMDAKYPYDPVYKHPFPKRPSFEAIDEALHFISLVTKSAGGDPEVSEASRHLTEQLQGFPPYREFSAKTARGSAHAAHEIPREISKKDAMLHCPVDAYLVMRHRLVTQGEVASFPEFSESVTTLLEKLNSPEIKAFSENNVVFRDEVANAIRNLHEVTTPSGLATSVHPAFHAPFPYRRTIHAIENAAGVFDLYERLRYPESKDWHEVEESWYLGAKEARKPKLLALYHFNRYKYQQFGLLANPDVILMPWAGDATMEDLLRLRPVPIGLVGVSPKTLRVDRHHNTPLDFWYHDMNHIRRMWGYDKRRIESMASSNWGNHEANLRSRQAFIEDLLTRTNPRNPGIDPAEKQIRLLERFVLFEVFHETALSATKDAVLNDLTRAPGVRQPFEVQKQTESYEKEKNRQFDGNLKSGADVLPLDFRHPTQIEYFFDRAPGFLSNIYNKLAWGFHGSVFLERKNADKMRYRTPEYLAEAVTRVFHHLGTPPDKIPSKEQMVAEILDRSGQPELYNYFALHPEDDISHLVRHRSKMHSPSLGGRAAATEGCEAGDMTYPLPKEGYGLLKCLEDVASEGGGRPKSPKASHLPKAKMGD